MNLFQIKFKKPLKLFQYPFSVTPVIDSVDLKIRNKLFIYAGIGEKENQKN